MRAIIGNFGISEFDETNGGDIKRTFRVLCAGRRVQSKRKPAEKHDYTTYALLIHNGLGYRTVTLILSSKTDMDYSVFVIPHGFLIVCAHAITQT